jgi:hypothetical protein
MRDPTAIAATSGRAVCSLEYCSCVYVHQAPCWSRTWSSRVAGRLPRSRDAEARPALMGDDSADTGATTTS